MPLSNLIDLNINNVKITFHALTRFQESDLKVREVFKALRTKFQIIEEYTDDPRGSSALLLLFIEEDPIHLVVAPHEDALIVITDYRPSKTDWRDNFAVRRQTSE